MSERKTPDGPRKRRGPPDDTQMRKPRGHWPAGKRRSTLTPAERLDVLSRVRAALRAGESLRGISRLVRVSDRTIRRWLRGEDWPTAQSARRVRALPRRRQRPNGQELAARASSAT